MVILRKNDRVVFLGDSITEQQLYTNQVESYLAGRFPDLNLTFFNAGWGGDVAPGGLARLERDVLSLKPSVVTICYGMNDAGYVPPSDEIEKRFADGMAALIRIFKKKKVRVVLLTPGFGDITANSNLKAVDYNRKGLRRLADSVLRLARREKLPVFDIHKLMTDVDRLGKKMEPGFNMAPDGFHPSPPGHLVMAYGLLKALGIPPRRQSIVLDARTGKIRSSPGTKARAERSHDGDWHFEISPADLPFFVEHDARRVLPYLDFQQAFNFQLFRVKNLKPGSYFFRYGPERSPIFTAAELSKGLDFNTFWNLPPMVSAQALRTFTNDKVGSWFKIWRSLALRGGPRETKLYSAKVHQAGIKAIPVWDRARTQLARDSTAPYSLRLISSATKGEALSDGDFISLWSLAGPLPLSAKNPLPAGEGRVRGDRTWTQHSLSITNAGNNLGEALGPSMDCCVFAAVDIESPVDQKAELLIGSDDGFAVWLDGALLASKLDVHRGLTFDQDRVPLRLSNGRNRLVIQVSQFAGGWGFAARFRGLKADVVARNDRV